MLQLLLAIYTSDAQILILCIYSKFELKLYVDDFAVSQRMEIFHSFLSVLVADFSLLSFSFQMSCGDFQD